MFAGSEVANRGLTDICPAYDAMKDMLEVLTFCKGKNHDSLHWGVESTVRRRRLPRPGGHSFSPPCVLFACARLPPLREQQSSYVNSQGITSVASSNLDGALCGDDPEGMYVSIGRGIKDLDDRVTTWGTSKRDGYVKIASCKIIKSSSWAISSTYVVCGRWHRWRVATAPWSRCTHAPHHCRWSAHTVYNAQDPVGTPAPELRGYDRAVRQPVR